MGSNLLFEAEIFFSFSSVIAESFFLTEQKEEGISAFKVVTESCCLIRIGLLEILPGVHSGFQLQASSIFSQRMMKMMKMMMMNFISVSCLLAGHRRPTIRGHLK